MELTTLLRPDIRSLKTEMLTYFTYPQPLRTAVAEMVLTWEAFCALPDAVKAECGYTPDDRFSGAGYELKKVPGKADLKENFHIRRDKRDFLYGEAKRVGVPELFEFLDASMDVYPELDKLVLEFAREVEDRFNVPRLAEDVEAILPSVIIRTLHYFGEREDGAVLGDPHCDKGGFTGHLYESAPGVERFSYDGRWVPMDVAEGQSAFFAGLGLQQRSHCALKAPCHRIVATPETAEGGRYSSVCFVNIANAKYYDKMRLGRTQNFAPGFNYQMPSAEFDALFSEWKP